MIRWPLVSLLLLWQAAMLNAQLANPAEGRIFSTSEIPKAHIIIDPDSLEALYDPADGNWWSNHEYPITFVWEDSQSADTLHDIGFRFRGNTSRNNAKKSFKISINSFESGRRYEGLKNLNFNAEVNDPSMLRSFATWNMYRDNGIPASRSNHVEVYINGDYYGLYQNCEHINDDWMRLRFGDDRGNLYKCTYPANLNFISEAPDAYKLSPDWSDERIYELKTNREADDYRDLAAFIQFLNQSNAVDFACDFQEHFNVYRYLKVLAIDVLTGNWDAYLFNQNNYYLYYHPRRARFEYLPYDLDNTWGIDWFGIDWATRNPYAYSSPAHDLPLYERLMAVPAYRRIFSWYLRHLSETYYYSTAQQDALLSRQLAIAPSAIADTFRPLDYGFSEHDFNAALHEAAGGHVSYGVFPFAELRRSSTFMQVSETAIAPIIWEVEQDFAPYPDAMRFRVRIDGPECSALSLHFRFDGGAWSSLTANNPTAQSLFALPIPEGAHTLEYNFSATGSNGLSREAYCQPRSIVYGGAQPGLYLNEVMARNASTIADEAGEYDDWIELYNGSGESIELSAYYLSDKHNAARYWGMPAQSIASGGFALVWADGDLEQGPMHANFSVSGSGERVYLFKELPNYGLELVDYVDVPPSQPDVSWGRASDGGLPWVSFDTPTPGASNGVLSSRAESTAKQDLPYPNPTSHHWMWRDASAYELLSPDGRVLLQGHGTHISAEGLAPGLYLLRRGEVVHRLLKQ